MTDGTHIMTDVDAGKRLDRVLPELLGISRSQVQKAVKAGDVLLDGKKVTPHVAIKEGQVVSWELHDKTIHVDPNDALVITIIHEDDQYLVIEKPADIVVHQASGHVASDTVVNWALQHAPSIRDAGDDPLRPGIVHRLDRDVSGVMVLAKTTKALVALIDEFSQGKTKKEYEAICYGVFESHDVTVDKPIARSKSYPGKMAARTAKGDDTKKAVTTFSVIEKKQHYTHVLVTPKTGRRHQIRVHAATISHPIVGDKMYAHEDLHPGRAPRLLLHATKLTFMDLDGKARTFESKAPKAFGDFLNEHG